MGFRQVKRVMPALAWDNVLPGILFSPTKQHLDEGPAPKATVGLPGLLSPLRGVTPREVTSRKQDLSTRHPNQAALPHMILL